MSDEIFEILNESENPNVIGIALKYQVFTNYLIKIVKNAIEKEDKVALFALHQIGTITDVDENELKDWQAEYEKFSEHLKSIGD